MDTIFALSSGMPPAGIGIIRITGPQASAAVEALAGDLPPPRYAARRRLTSTAGMLDDGLVLWFPGPASVTGEDVAEMHVHGGRAVISAVEAALAELPGLRRAEPGEFTKRAFFNGRIDLAEAEGLADLLAAETETQRQAALAMASGLFSRRVEDWRSRLMRLSALLEAALDFDGEDDIAGMPESFAEGLAALRLEINEAMSAPAAEALREGFRIALAGPPNAGKSTLFNALIQSEDAITAPIAGTTRDVLVRSVAISGIPFTFVDMAGLRDCSTDPIEEIGIGRARDEIARADLTLWLGPEGVGPEGSWEIEAQCDRPDRATKKAPLFRVSALTGDGLADLAEALLQEGTTRLRKPNQVAINRRQRAHLHSAGHSLDAALNENDPLLTAEMLRQTRLSFDGLTGRASTEDVLDALFGRFCLGK